MRLDLNSDQQFFQETVRRFVETETPIATVRELMDSIDGFDRSWWRQGAELGWTSFLLPEDLGGGSVSGEGPVDLVIVAEEIGRAVAPGPLLPVNVVAETIARAGSNEQQALLAGVLTGDVVFAWCFNEPGQGWGAEDIAMEARRDGDSFVLNGLKTAVEAGGQADHFLVTARTADGLTQFLLPANTEGVSVTQQTSLDLSKRFARIEFNQVSCGLDAVVGSVDRAAGDVARQVQVALLLQCAETCGAVAKVFEFTVEWAFARHSFGRPLASYQALKHRFADMKLWLEASSAITDSAAKALAHGHDVDRMVSAAKAYVGDKSVDIIQDCVQLHGGIGVTWEHDIHLYLRRATVNRGLFGTPEQHRDDLAQAVGA
jgi:alkylation response protein AidB-like acyl-CoA dehydrogenase